jgi:hypothetical protein
MPRFEKIMLIINKIFSQRNGPILEEQKKKISTDLGIKIEEAEQVLSGLHLASQASTLV